MPNEYNQKVQLTFNNLKADGNSRMTDLTSVSAIRNVSR
jgi:uncharacterized protein YdgA (DUF945 family)